MTLGVVPGEGGHIVANTDDPGYDAGAARGSKKHGFHGRKLSWLFRIVAYSVFSILLLSVDLFGLSWRANQQSEKIIFSFLSPLYGTGSFVARSPRPMRGEDSIPRWNENITVLQIDDRFLRENKFPWPVSRRIHARILEDLHENFEPDVIFVDILFMDEWVGDRGGLNELARVLREIKEKGKTKVFLASLEERPDKFPILTVLTKEAETAVVRWSTGSRVSRSALYYPLADRAGAPDAPDSSGAAFTIYRYLCDRKLILKCPEDMNDFDQDYRRPMQVFWGIDPPDLNWEQSNRFMVPCNDRGASFFGHAKDILIGGFLGEDGSAPQTCPYAQLIKARDFYLDRDAACDDAGRSGAKTPFRCHGDVQQAYRKAFARNREAGPKIDGPRIVFYGVDVAGADDIVETPTHGQINGVFLHAMALDNLLTMGDGYLRPCGLRYLSWLDAPLTSVRDSLPSCELVGGMTAVSIFLTLAVVVISVLLTDLGRRTVTDGPPGGGLSRLVRRLLELRFGGSLWLAVRTFIVLLFLLVAVVLLLLFERQAPANWVGILSIAAILTYIDQNYAQKRVEQLFELIFRHE